MDFLEGNKVNIKLNDVNVGEGKIVNGDGNPFRLKSEYLFIDILRLDHALD